MQVHLILGLGDRRQDKLRGKHTNTLLEIAGTGDFGDLIYRRSHIKIYTNYISTMGYEYADTHNPICLGPRGLGTIKG